MYKLCGLILFCLASLSHAVEVRPWIQGTFTDGGGGPGTGCWVKDLCVVNRYQGWIDASSQDYIYFNGFELTESNGEGFLSKFGNNIQVENFKIDHTANASINLNYTSNSIIKNGQSSRGGLCGGTSAYEYTECPGGPGVVSIHRGSQQNKYGGLIENVFSFSHFGEGISCWSSNNCIVRANRVYDTFSSAIYIDGCNDCVVEHNIVGNGSTDRNLGFQRAVTNDLDTGVECYPGGTNCNASNTLQLLVRNNIITNVEECANTGVLPGNQATATPTVPVKLKWYGNTCYGMISDTAWMLAQGPDPINTEEFDIQNNILYSPSSAPVCNINSLVTGVITDYNLWRSNPGGRCSGVNDVYTTTPNLINESSLANNTYYGITSWAGNPIPLNNVEIYAGLSPGSSAINAGNPSLVSTNCVDSTNFPNWNNMEWGRSWITAAKWNKCLAYDFDGRDRGTTPDIGAIETNYNTLTGYFLDPVGGSDSNNGTSHTQAWKTASHAITQLSGNTGADLYILAGTTQSTTGAGPIIDVSWSGNSSNQGTVGCYFVSGGQEYECTGSQTRPIIEGDYDEVCADPTVAKCDVTSRFSSLVRVRDKDYITIKDLHVRYSESRGITIDSTATYSSGTHQVGNQVINTRVDHIADYGILMEQQRDFLVEYNEVSRTGYCTKYREKECTSDQVADGGPRGTWPGAVGATQSRQADGIFQHNNIYNIYGEGMASLLSSNIIYRRNTVGNTHSTTMYNDNGEENVFEQNILYGFPPGTEQNTNRLIGGFGHGKESYFAQIDPEKVLFRNNLLVSGTTGCYQAVTWDLGQENDVISGWFLGNTCIGMRQNNWYELQSATITNASITADNWYVANNIFYSQANDTQCGTGWLSGVTMGPNLWRLSVSGTNCASDGTADVIGAPTTQTPYATLLTLFENLTFSDVIIQGGSLADNKGDDWSSTSCMTTTDFTEAFSHIDTLLTIGQWANCLYADAFDTPRSSLPTLGAVEAIE